MKGTWADPGHVGKITISILDILSKEFHKAAKKEETEKDYDLIIKLSQAAGYQAQLYSGLQKSHEFARRLQSIEATLKTATPEGLAMGMSPVLQAEEELKTQFQGR
jgi:hypothetical protein